MPLPDTNVATNTPFLSVKEDLFSANIYHPPLMNGDALNSGFIAGNDCDMNILYTDFTPMSEGSWNRMLQNENNLLANIDPVNDP